MEKTLFGIACFFAYVFSIQAQTLPNQEQVDRHNHSGKGGVILYGTTPQGGNDGGGTINKFEPLTNTLEVVHSFESLAKSPGLSLIQAKNGKLYGMTSSGGKNNVGVIFSFNPATKTFTKLDDFDKINGASPHGSLVQAKDGKLYGMTEAGGTNDLGVIFSFDLSSSKYTKLKDFYGSDGRHPYGSLIQATDGKLYGSAGGVIFSFDPASKSYTTLQSFGGPEYGDLMQAKDGKMYGMTSGGGSYGYGGIFSFDPSSATYTKLVDFDNNNGASPWGSLIQANDGKLYGMTPNGGNGRNGVIFSFDPSSSNYTKLLDFGYYGSLMQASDGKLYGMDGGIFSFDPSSSTFTMLKYFNDSNGPVDSYGSLMQASDGKLYGMEQGGIMYSAGVIFSFDPLSTKITVSKDLATNQDGSVVSGSVIQATDGKMYGMTTDGGSNGVGVIFSFDPSSSKFIKLKDFDYANGCNPTGNSLVQANDGKLYGMTNKGGSAGLGGIFSFDPSTSTYTKLKDFDNINGSNPYGSLMQASDGKLYGMAGGGTSGLGVIFSFDPSTSQYTKLKDLDNSNGGYPNGSLIQANDGKLYGVTLIGGIYGYGVIFSVDPSSSTYTKLKDLDKPNGLPTGSLVQASDGKLYGMTTYGGSHIAVPQPAGVIFSFDPSSSIYTKLKDFDKFNPADPLASPNGTMPLGSLMQASDGKLYGMTEKGGANGLGVIFSFDPSSSTYTKLQDYDGANGASPGLGSAFIEESTQPLLSISDATVYEAEQSVTLTVTLSKKTDQDVSADFKTVNGTAKIPFDYTKEKGTVTIPAGSQSTSISVPVISDNVVEPTEQFYVELDKPVNAGIGKSTGTVTILDGAPLNSTIARTSSEQQQIAAGFMLKASPNPSSSQFTLEIESNNSNELLSLRVVDVLGKIVEERNNIFPGQTLQIGNNYKPGVYFVILTQGNNKKQVKLIKL